MNAAPTAHHDPSTYGHLRALFRVGIREQTAQFAQHAATLAEPSSASHMDASRERALAALRMYCAREAIEEIELALVHIENSVSMRRPADLDAINIVLAALRALARRGDVSAPVVAAAIDEFRVETEPTSMVVPALTGRT